MQRRKTIGIIVVLLVLSLGLFACGGSDDSDTDTAAPAPAQSQAPAPAPAAAPAPAPAPAPAQAPSIIQQSPAAPPPPPPPAAAPAAKANIPSSCYIEGQQVSTCPEASPHTWAVPATPPGDFPVWHYTGAIPSQFFESPMSAQLVREGKLPPLDQRVPKPEDRMYSVPADEIGTYGGIGRQTMHFVFMGELALSNFGEREADGFTWRPFVGKSWEFSEDGRVLSFIMREGLKWSDGEDFDMEDVEFAWTDMKQPPYVEDFPIRYRDPVTGNDVRWNKVDDLTFTLSFDSPVFNIMEARANRGPDCWIGRMCWFSPKHFLTQFMPEYIGQAQVDAMMKADEVDNFEQWWGDKTYSFFNPDSPCARAWCLEVYDPSATGILARNHYFWGFDPEGNQLPYLDGIQQFRMENRDVAVFRWFAGEHDIPATAAGALTEVPFYVRNMEAGDYSVYHWPSFGGNDMGLALNGTWNEDPFIGQMIRTRDFRIALSYAIDRPEINESLFLSLGAIQNFVPRPDNPYYPGDDIRELHLTRDVAKANQMLDAIGLDKRDDEGFRLRPDGQRLVLQMNTTGPHNLKGMEIVGQQLEDVGLEFKGNNRPPKIRENGDYASFSGSAYQYNPWMLDNTQLAPLGSVFYGGVLIGIWHESKGREGMAPGSDPNFLPLAPPENFAADPSGNIKRLADLWFGGRQHPQFSPGRSEAGKEIYRINVEEKYVSGTVAFTGIARGVAVKRNNMRNVPKTHIRDHFGFMAWNYGFEDGQDNLNNPGNRSKKFRSVSFFDPDFYFNDEK